MFPHESHYVNFYTNIHNVEVGSLRICLYVY